MYCGGMPGGGMNGGAVADRLDLLSISGKTSMWLELSQKFMSNSRSTFVCNSINISFRVALPIDMSSELMSLSAISLSISFHSSCQDAN